MRSCGSCTLCCKLLAVRELGKDAGERCRHQGLKGCGVYRTRAMPSSCALWNCAWLGDPSTRDLGRPDRSHYVIDVMPDFVEAQDNETGEITRINVVQVWCDPKHPDAWKDKGLLAWLEVMAREKGMGALIRYDSRRGFGLFAPALTADGKWHRNEGQSSGIQHSVEEIFHG